MSCSQGGEHPQPVGESGSGRENPVQTLEMRPFRLRHFVELLMATLQHRLRTVSIRVDSGTCTSDKGPHNLPRLHLVLV